MSPVLSIITCTRNPRSDLLARVLASVASMRVPEGYLREYVIVDSASTPSLGIGGDQVIEFLREHSWARSVREEEPGQMVARRAGIRAAAGDLIIWIDDDNVPAIDYLECVVRVAATHRDVTVWGAGTIDVEFVDPVPEWVDSGMRSLFQQRAHGRDEFGSATAWAPFFPVGSGMVTRRGAAERWSGATLSGRYSLTGRMGNRLSSGDDAQIILGAVAAGERVGVATGQRLTHLIPASRCRMDYVVRLEFALGASIRVARAECFPDDPAPRTLDGLGARRAARATLGALRRHGVREARLECARRLGALAGALETINRPEPWWLRAAIASLGLR